MSTELAPCTAVQTDLITGLHTTEGNCYVFDNTDKTVTVYWNGNVYTHTGSEYADVPLKVEGTVCGHGYTPCNESGVAWGYHVEVPVSKEMGKALPPTGFDVNLFLIITVPILAAALIGGVTIKLIERRRRNKKEA